MADTELQRSLTNVNSESYARNVGESSGQYTFSIPDLLPSFRVHLEALNRAERTINDYVRDAEAFAAWIVDNGIPADVTHHTREHIETYLAAELDRPRLRGKGRMSPGTVASNYRRLQQFYKWLVEEGEIPTSPMVNMKPPAVADNPPPVVELDHIKAMLAECQGAEFTQRRDTAIIRFLYDSGSRRKETAFLSLADVDVVKRKARVVGKGRGGGKPRDVSFGAKTAQALDRYIRARAKHPHAALPWLWLGQRGHFGYWGIGQMLEARAADAGIPHVHAHLFRHTMSHQFLLNGGAEGDLMSLNGWETRAMVDRYGRSAAGERAREAHKKMGLGDQL